MVGDAGHGHSIRFKRLSVREPLRVQVRLLTSFEVHCSKKPLFSEQFPHSVCLCCTHVLSFARSCAVDGPSCTVITPQMINETEFLYWAEVRGIRSSFRDTHADRLHDVHASVTAQVP